jgi:outer membrane protein assembly factor BamB
MTSTPLLRRWLSFAGTGVVFAIVLGILLLNREPAPEASSLTAAQEKARHSWPVWGGTVQRNLVNLFEKNVPTDWDNAPGKEKNILWSANLGSKAYGGPTIGGGKIFIGTNNNRPRDKNIHGDKGVLMCFSEAKGEFLWQRAFDKLEAGRVNDWPEEGICSAPAIEGNQIWYICNRCEVICSTHDNKIVWKLDMIKDLGVFPHNLATCSPIIVGDTLFVITSNGVDEGHVNIPAPNAPSFLAIDKKTGKVLWSSKAPGRNIMHGQWSNPLYTVVQGTPQVIFPGGDGFIYSFNPKNGELIWKFDCNPKASYYRLGPAGTRNDFVSTPVIWENKLYIGVGQDPEHKKGVGHLWCIDITKKPKNKEKDLSPYSPPRKLPGDKIDPNEAYGEFDPKDPRNKDSGLVWHYGGRDPDPNGVREYLFCRTLSTCAVHDGLCFAADFEGFVFCFDARTGKKLWEHEMGTDTWSSPYIVDGKVYLGNENGVMHIFEASKKLKLIKKVQMKGKIRATPVVCNGVLYVMTENPCKLWAIK